VIKVSTAVSMQYGHKLDRFGVLQEDEVTSECCGAEIIVGDCASQCAECGNSVNPDSGKSYGVKTACFGGLDL